MWRRGPEGRRGGDGGRHGGGSAELEGLDPGAVGEAAPAGGPAEAPAGAAEGAAGGAGTAGWGGWRYAVGVPGWEVREPAASSGDSGVVVFRVDVRVRGPGAPSGSGAGATAAHTVLRRFSDFRRLHAVLEGLFSEEMAGHPPPPKRSLLGRPSREESLERRRVQLEVWLRSLTELRAVAASEPMLQFLQLDALAQDAKELTGEPDQSRSPMSPSPLVARAKEHSPPPPRAASGSPGRSGGFGFLGPSPKYREALELLQGAAAASASERRHALDCLAAETAAKELLARRVDELERDAEAFAKRLERSRAEGGAAASERLAVLEYEVEDFKRRASGAEEGATQVAEALVSAEARAAEAEARAADLQLELDAASNRTREVEERLKSLRSDAQKDIATMLAEVQRHKHAAEELERRLIAQAAQAGKRADSEREQAEQDACEAMLGEAAAVRQRLQDCSLERLGEEEKAGGSPGPNGGQTGAAADAAHTEELLELSDSRLGFLIAEAQVLAEPPRGGGGGCGPGWERSEAAVRKALSGFLVDQAQLRKVSNALLRAQLPARRLDGVALAGEGRVPPPPEMQRVA